jgi:hypothetical protein
VAAVAGIPPGSRRLQGLLGQPDRLRGGVGVERRLSEAVVAEPEPRLITSREYASRVTESAVAGWPMRRSEKRVWVMSKVCQK